MSVQRPAPLRARLEALLSSHWWRPRPSWLALLLAPLALLYRLLLALARSRAKSPPALPVPVIVVGNLVVGGAGKTPTVIALVQALQQAGRRPGVISRGHGRQGDAVLAVSTLHDAAAAGDEPLLIRRRCGVPVFVGRVRADAARALCAAHPEVDVLVSDDGLQHAALARQAELWVFDERGAGNGWLLPAGPLREPLPDRVPPQARVLYTAGHRSTALPGTLAQRSLGLAWPLAAWHRGEATEALPLQALRGSAFVAAAGLAAPQKFFAMLQAEHIAFVPMPLPDHHPYDTLPWPEGTPQVITTEKDAIKLDPARLGATRVWVVPLDLQLPAGLVDDLLALLPPPARLPHPPP